MNCVRVSTMWPLVSGVTVVQRGGVARGTPATTLEIQMTVTCTRRMGRSSTFTSSNTSQVYCGSLVQVPWSMRFVLLVGVIWLSQLSSTFLYSWYMVYHPSRIQWVIQILALFPDPLPPLCVLRNKLNTVVEKQRKKAWSIFTHDTQETHDCCDVI